MMKRIWLANVSLERVLGAAALLGTAYVLATFPLTTAVALLGGVGFTLVVLVRPVWALYALPFLVPFPLREVRVGPATVGGLEALLALFIAAWLARGLARREIIVRTPPLSLPLALLLGSMLLSLVNAFSLSAAAKELVKWLEVAALYTIAWHELRRRDLLIIVLALLTAGALAAAQGIYQSVFRVGPPGFLFPLAGRLWLRAYGTFAQPNPYAGYLGLTLPLAYGLLLAGLGALPQRDDGVPLLVRSAVLGYAAITGALMLLALFFSLSRGAWIGAAAAVLVVSMLLSRRAFVGTLLAGVAGALFLALGGWAYVPLPIRERLTDFLPYVGLVDVRAIEVNDRTFAIVERLAHWYAAVGMFADFPWLGGGIGNYAARYPMYKLPPWDDPLGHAHNIYLNVAAETGLVGLSAYLLFWAAALWLAWRAVRQTTGLWRGMAIGALGAFVHLSAHNFFDNLYVHGMYVQVALLLAIVAVLVDNRGSGWHEQETVRQPSTR
ncbi:MAG: O-antigen ligase domain-containing protein [Ardenticatenia bacterium]|nr:MAG: O-antigen ligase domain-containing protein [Ardenticatenia bacterium]